MVTLSMGVGCPTSTTWFLVRLRPAGRLTHLWPATGIEGESAEPAGRYDPSESRLAAAYASYH